MQCVLLSVVLLNMLFLSMIFDIEDHAGGRGGRIGIREATIERHQDYPELSLSLTEI